MYGQMSKQISNNSYFMHIVGIFEWFRSLELRRITHKKKLILKNRMESEEVVEGKKGKNDPHM